ncbi:putative alpha-glucosidase domain protein, partial [Bacteroides fragilis str. 3397 T10]
MIKKEATGFAFPDGTTTFLCPQSKPMGGFARTSPSYETSYTADDVAGKNGWGEGYTFPCLFRNGDNGWVLVSETGVNGGYCASRLLGHKEGVYTIGFPQEGEANGNGTVSPGIALPGETPWRTITVGKTLAPIVETTVPFDVVKPLYQAKGEYTYGRGSWSWIIGMDGSTNYKEQLRYIDFSAAMGYQSVLVDALWDKQIGRDKIEELAKYGKNKGVAL